jgi:hypothetical protein
VARDKLISGVPEVVLVLIGLALVTGWWLRGSISRGQIEGLKEQVTARGDKADALQERLNLARDQFVTSKEAKAELERQLYKLNKQIEDKIPVYGALAQTSAAAVSSLRKLDELERGVATTLNPEPSEK